MSGFSPVDSAKAKDGQAKFAPVFRRVDPPDLSPTSPGKKQFNRWKMIPSDGPQRPSPPSPPPPENEILPNLLPTAKAGVRTGMGWSCPYCQRFFKKEGLCSKKHLAKEHGDYSTLHDDKMRDFIALKVQRSPEDSSSLSPPSNASSSFYSPPPTNVSHQRNYTPNNTQYNMNSSSAGNYSSYPQQQQQQPTYSGSANLNSGQNVTGQCMYDSPPGSTNTQLQTSSGMAQSMIQGGPPPAVPIPDISNIYQQYNQQPVNNQSSNFNANSNSGKNRFPSWTCQQCGTSFEKIDSTVQEHLSGTHNWTKQQIEIYFQRKYICLLCGKQCDSIADLNRHNKTHFITTTEKPRPPPKEINNPPKIFDCELCGSSFRSEKFLTHHLLNIHDAGMSDTFICLVCQEIVPGPIELQGHISVEHANQKKYLCSKCDKCFVHRYYLEKHEMLHESKGHMCEICDKSFARADHLRKHVLKHTGVRPFECQICEQRFRDSSSLRRHTRVHLDIKPYQCPVCSNRYIRMDKLKIHVLRHHPDSGLDLSDHTKFKVIDPEEEHILKVFLGPKAANSAVPQSYIGANKKKSRRTVNEDAENSSEFDESMDEPEGSDDDEEEEDGSNKAKKNTNDNQNDPNEAEELPNDEARQGGISQGSKRKLDQNDTNLESEKRNPYFPSGGLEGLQPIEKSTKISDGDNQKENNFHGNVNAPSVESHASTLNNSQSHSIQRDDQL